MSKTTKPEILKPEAKPGEVLIEYLDAGPDSLNRRHFVLHWFAPYPVCHPDGHASTPEDRAPGRMQAQVFHAVPEEIRNTRPRENWTVIP